MMYQNEITTLVLWNGVMHNKINDFHFQDEHITSKKIDRDDKKDAE